MSVFYVAVLARNSEGEIFATVPDLPGVNSAAATRAEALAFAIEFANDYVHDLIGEGHEVPAARDMDDIPIEEEDEEIGRALIPVELPGKSVKVSISIDEALLVRIDRAAERTGLTRSGFIAAAAEDRIRSSAVGNGTFGANDLDALFGFSEAPDHANYRYQAIAHPFFQGGANKRIRGIYPQIVGRDPRTGLFLVSIDPQKEPAPRRARKAPARKGSD
jgi:predicted RNase H-like HicB family nuclease